MIWSLLSQYAVVVLSTILLIRLFRLRLHFTYLPLLVFVFLDGVMSLLFIPLRQYRLFDYRIYVCLQFFCESTTTIWVVYALLIGILKHLPGILRFSLWFLNVVFFAWLLISFLLSRPEYSAYGLTANSAPMARVVVIIYMLGRVFSLAELLVILSVLAFVLRFPIRVPRNLAVFSAAFSILLLFQIVFFWLFTFVPEFRSNASLRSIPSFVMSACLVYWIVSLSAAGEKVSATLGREWQSVPKEHLVRQLEAMNAALLRSREQSS